MLCLIDRDTDRSNGPIAFVPLGADSDKFEAIDDPTAAKAGIVRKLMADTADRFALPPLLN